MCTNLKYKISFLVVCLVSALGVFSQNLSNRGKEFWVAYGHHQFMEPGQTNSQEMVLYFSAEEAATVTVKINGTNWVRTYNVPANRVISSETMPKSGTYDCRLFSLPPSYGGTGGEGLFTRGISISSNVPIVAYAHTYGSASSGASMLMPIETWGHSYISVNSNQTYQPNCFSWAFVIANHDNTVVEIVPSQLTRAGRQANQPFSVTLNKGEIYQVIGANPTSGTSALELTGTRFKSLANSNGVCYPIAVFSGSSRTSNPMPCGSGGGDNDNQQLFPTQAWGKRYLTAPLANTVSVNNNQTNGYKVIIRKAGTVVRRNGVVLTNLANGAYFFTSNTADLIEANEPIMVAQFMTGGGCLGGGLGDPEMIIISPIEQGTNKVGFFRNNQENITFNYLTMVVPNGGTGLSSLTIDGQPLSAITAANLRTYPHPRSSAHTVVVRRWTGFSANANTPPGQCLVSSDSAFTAVTYGLGSVESYGYNAGTMINNLSAISSIQNDLDKDTKEHDFTCVDAPVNLSVLMAYEPTRMVWKLSDISTIISPATDITVNSPVPVETVLVKGVPYYKYTLPGTYKFNKEGVHQLPILSTHQSVETCDFTEELKILIDVEPVRISDFTMTRASDCTLDSVLLKADGNTSNNENLKSWKWALPGNVTITGKDTVHVFKPGLAQPVALTVVTDNGCISTFNKTIDVFEKPVADFTTVPTAICVDAEFELTPSVTYSGTSAAAKWWWQIEGAETTAGSNVSQKHTFDEPGLHTVKLAISYGDLCVSDTITKQVRIYEKPTFAITLPDDCLPVSGVVKFTNATATTDGQNITVHDWHFGDQHATTANPNISSDAEPTHNYSTFGTYNISYKATTQYGCVKDTTIERTFKLSPDVTFAAINAICVNAEAITLNQGSVRNGVPGTGVYSGKGVADGKFDPAVAGVGVHTITYTFTSDDNCVGIATFDITVYDKPTVDFATNTGSCIPENGLVQFENNTTVSDGQVLTWAWNFNDAAATASNPNTSSTKDPTHLFQEGKYQIELSVETANGCVEKLEKEYTFNLMPVVTYGAQAPLCANADIISLANATARLGNAPQTGGVYSGAGIDAAGQFDASVAKAGIHPLTFTYTSAAGCEAAATSSIEVFAVPEVDFESSAASCIPANGLVTFTNKTTLSSGEAMTWSWSFTGNNGGTSTVKDPSYNFQEGAYKIALTATTANSCSETLSKDFTFNLTPVVAYGTQIPLCENADAVSLANATAFLGSVSQTGGIYSGTGINAGGEFSPSVAKAGLHTLTYTYTSTAGCEASATTTILVDPVPTALFTAQDFICIDQSLLLQDHSTIASGNIVSWSWNFGDGNTVTRSNGSSFSHDYTDFKSYDLGLRVTSDKGCQSDLVNKSVVVHPLPVVDFTIPSVICMPNGEAVFVNNTTEANGATLSYSWNMGVTGAPAIATKDVNYIYPSINNYTVALVATSIYGCDASLSKQLPSGNFYGKPTARFSITPAELCQGVSTVFTESSTAQNNTIEAWHWLLGDGTTSTQRTPEKSYNRPGTYNVSLTIKDGVGCYSDTARQVVRVHPQPVIDAGRSFVVAEGSVITFSATSNSLNYNFSWSPAIGLNDPNALNPTATVTQDQVYTLTAVGAFNCSATDDLTVKILRNVVPPNAFSPNGDGINDTWTIKHLADYTNATISVFDRYSKRVFYSVGYNTPWDGTVGGKPLPVGTYYYLIELRNGFSPIKGSVTIVR
ncbi:PKD domain-containing protein [Polluticaenibacter yanchengensis]|uniref:PKD domain-containing protein n=1 Tax=Polluticaenibacter yanchengensis TaxID=3014562 RepID=A0ABT4UL03_9BACT|nr:PKD domain-containing protein [Chitinophagaceae bacterium LY-5]